MLTPVWLACRTSGLLLQSGANIFESQRIMISGRMMQDMNMGWAHVCSLCFICNMG